jgi:molybdopterin/thiamine biosynthesis adenylyltransferase
MDFYEEAFKRNIGLFSEEEQKKLKGSRVAIAGLGGVGGVHLVTLARMGLGKFHIADLDTFETANINRQYGAMSRTLGKLKTEVMGEAVLEINPEAEIESFSEGVTEKNVDNFLDGVDVAIDGIDFFAIDARRLLFNKAREKGITAITSGPIGFGATLQIFTPLSMSFNTYFGITDDMSYIEKMIAFAVGLTPKALHLRYLDLTKVDLSSGTGPALASSCSLCAGLVATEAVNVILAKRPVRATPHYFQFDPYRQVYKKGYLFMGGRNPIQKIKRRYLLKKVSHLIEE